MTPRNQRAYESNFIMQMLTIPSKAQFRRRVSALPHLIAIRFDCSTAEERPFFRRRARDVPNSGFSEAT